MAIVRAAILVGLLSVSCPQKVWADQLLTNADFLNWSEDTQRWWIGAAALMAGHVAFLENPERGGCVWRWYFDDADAKKALVIRSMEKHPDSTPTGVLIALMERACGKFPRKPKTHSAETGG